MARPTDDPKTSRMDLRLPPRIIEAVDDFRRHEPDIPARAEAIRRLLEIGIHAIAIYEGDGTKEEMIDLLRRRQVKDAAWAANNKESS